MCLFAAVRLRFRKAKRGKTRCSVMSARKPLFRLSTPQAFMPFPCNIIGKGWTAKCFALLASRMRPHRLWRNGRISWTATTILKVKRSEEHTSEPQSLMPSSYDVFCLTKKNKRHHHQAQTHHYTTRHIMN